jgi:hypothetical protein
MRRHGPHPPAFGARADSADGDRACSAFRPAGEVLGGEHPLSRTVSALDAVTRHVLTAGGLLAVGAAAAAIGATWGAPLTVAAGAVLLALAAASGLLVSTRAAHARALIEQGGEDVPVAAVRRERDRLLDHGRRADTARLLERIADRRAEPWPAGPVRPLHAGG